MPATQRGQAYRLARGKWGLRYYDAQGERRRKSPFPTKSAALAWYRNTIEPQLRGEPAAVAELTLAEFVPLYLDRHAVGVRARTITDLRKRLKHATCAFGDIPLRDLERMSGEIAAWQTTLPERSRYGIVSVFRQTLGGAVRWGHMAVNPAVLAGRNRQPAPRVVRAYNRAELEAIAAELQPAYAPLPMFAAATGLRPEEWQALERRDIDRRAGLVNVVRTVSSGEVVELGKTKRSRRQVPLSRRAAAALDALPPRLDTPLVFPAILGRVLNLDNLAPPGLGACDRGGRRPPTRSDLRHAVDVRLRRARGGRERVRARAHHGHERADDRTPLRDAARRRHRGDREPLGRARRGA
jgi:integrase